MAFLAAGALVPGLAGTARAVAAITPTASTDGQFSWNAHPVADDSDFAEPSVDVDHANRIFVTAPGGAGVQMWRSFDGGATFDHKEIASPGGGGDSEIEFDLNDVGFTADLAIVNSNVSRSTDHFNSWTQQGVGIEQDRQWLGHFCEKLVYLAYHDFVAEAEMINTSADSGQTWSPTPVFISPAPGGQDPGEIADQGGNTFSGPVVVDQKTGDVYVVFAISSVAGNLTTGVPPYGDPEQIVVGISHDGAKTFQTKLIKGGGPGSLAGLIFPWATIDKAGTVYLSWAGRDAPTDPINTFLVHSSDHGASWSAPQRINQDVGNAHIYTTISGGDPGVVDMGWYTSTKPDPSDTDADWFVDFAQVRGADTASPQVAQSRPYPGRIHHGDVCLEGILCIVGGDRSLLDFFQVQIGPDGLANIAFANNGSPDDTGRVWYARQTAGPSAGNGLHDTDHCAAAQGAPQVVPAAAPAPGPGAGAAAARRPTPSTGGRSLFSWALLAVGAALAGRTALTRRRGPPTRRREPLR